jgi:hypothetical protein
VADWHQMQHSTMNLDNHLSANIKKKGARFPDDPAFEFLQMGNA